MADYPTIMCCTHGEQQETFVCQHIIAGLRNKVRVGFYWSTEDPNNPRPDAYCEECNNRVRLTQGEWVGEALEYANPQILCGACYDAAKIFHMGGDPWS